MNVNVNINIITLGLLFFLVSNNYTYEFVNNFIPVKTSSGPTLTGSITHSLVFMIIILLIEQKHFSKLF